MASLIIFDWDDTLFPTSWVISSKINTNSYVMTDLDNIVYTILKHCLRYGTVLIVTNAMPEWVHMSSNSLPKTKKLIGKYIQIISARNLYQKKFPEDQKIPLNSLNKI